MSATTTQLLSSGEFCKLRYDTIPVKGASANVSFYSNDSKMPNFELWHSCRKWAICEWHFHNTGCILSPVSRSLFWTTLSHVSSFLYNSHLVKM